MTDARTNRRRKACARKRLATWRQARNVRMINQLIEFFEDPEKAHQEMLEAMLPVAIAGAEAAEGVTVH